MTRKRRGKRDLLEDAIVLALNPDAFISYHSAFSFVSDLEEVADKIAQLTKTEPARAAALYDTFLAACYEKVEEIDDSGGNFGQFVEDLICGWIRARQAAGADPDATAAALLARMDDDPYAFCYRIEKSVAKAFDRRGLAAFEKRVRARFDKAASAKPWADGSVRERYAGDRQEWGEVLRALYIEQKNVAAYVALAEATGLAAQDCLAIANLHASRRGPEEALVWVDRGIELDRKTTHGSLAGIDLAKLKRELLTKLGRGDEALADAWAAYLAHPSKYAYADLMKFVPKAERSAWHDKAIEAATGADLQSLIELFLETKETKETERLAELVRSVQDEALERESHYSTEPAAKKLEKNYPDLAARLWRAQGMRIVNAKKSKYYDAALSNFERALRCYEKAGLTAEWDKFVSRVRSEHHRKARIMSGFDDLMAGHGPSTEPSFLERAKARWRTTLSCDFYM